jgi:tRNA-splicing ligase RtcB (3'-phosphate/5'-hydroxy nucleic acid ligase)
MEINLLSRVSDFEWRIEAHGKMLVPAVLYASEELIRKMDTKVYEQIVNVATLPGIQKAAYAMPDAHWGTAFPSAALRLLIPRRVVLCRRAESASISPAA